MFNATIKAGRIRNTFSALAGEAIGKYKCVYAHSAGQVRRGSNSDFTRADIIGVALQDTVAGQRGSFLSQGELVNDSWGWVSGGELYVDELGDLSQDLPHSRKVICLVGTAVTDKKVFIDINKTIIKTA